MDYLTFKQLLLDVTGRTDLIDPSTYASTGIDFYVEAAQKFLDGKCEIGETVGHGYYDLVDAGYIVFTGIRSIHHVYLINNDVKTKLELVSLHDLLPVKVSTTGTPAQYAPAYLRNAFDTMVPTEFIVPTGDVRIYNGVVFNCVADGTYVVQVVGTFYSTPLIDDADESIWSMKHPELLVKAVNYQLEVFFRNTAGQKDWLQDIMLSIESLEHDYIDTSLEEKVWAHNG